MLDLVEDCLRFVTGYFEIISASCAHIYHSALVVAPQESIVRQLYESHAQPFTRIVHGAPTSWDPNTATTSRPSTIDLAVWSPCSRFIAIAWGERQNEDEALCAQCSQRSQQVVLPRWVG